MSFFAASVLLTAIASFLLAIFVYSRGPQKVLNRSLALFSLALAVWTFAQAMGEVVMTKELVLIWTRIQLGAAVFLPVFFLHFIFSLLAVNREKKYILWGTYIIALGFILLDFTPLFVADVAPAQGFRYYPTFTLVYGLFAFWLILSFIYGFVLLIFSLRQATGDRYRKLLYVFAASLIGFAGGGTTFFPIFNVDLPVISHFALPIYVALAVYAIVRHKLIDITVYVRKGLVYSIITIIFSGFYVLALLVTNYLIARFGSFSPALTVLLVVFIAALIFSPLRDRIQRTVDRIFFMGEYRYQKTIADLSEENRRLFLSLLRADKLASLGTLSAGMAHEIKNPLASIKGMTQVLDENLADQEFITRYQDVVSRQIDRINSIVEKLLKFGQPSQLAIAEIDLNKVVEEVLNLFENQCRKKNIRIEKHTTELPLIKGDKEQLSQVVINLILNAIQAMPEGGKLVIGTHSQGPGIAIEVADTGIGIGTEGLERIFDPFYSTKEGGAGMGLAVAYRSVKEHQGEIQVESQSGKGTRFTVWLPIKPEQ